MNKCQHRTLKLLSMLLPGPFLHGLVSHLRWPCLFCPNLNTWFQARAAFLLKIADRIDARLDELALAESRDQVLIPFDTESFANQVYCILYIFFRASRWTWLRKWTSLGLPSTSGSLLRFWSLGWPSTLFLAGLATPPWDEQRNAWGRSDQLQLKASGKFSD